MISDGVLPIPAHVLAHNVEPKVLDAWLDDQFLPHEVAEWPLNILVVRSGDTRSFSSMPASVWTRISSWKRPGDWSGGWRPPEFRSLRSPTSW